MASQYIRSANLRPPAASQSVYREDCTQCFGSIDDPSGLDVCLTCFNGGCQQHAPLHFKKTNHPLAVNIKRTRKPKKRDEPPQKITKLAIAAETEEDVYDTRTSVKYYPDDSEDVPVEGNLASIVDAVLKANTFAKQAEVQAWQQELTSCEHILLLQQAESRQIESQDLGHCSKCELKENLWICLSCGNLGCGRPQFGGSGGNGHGVAHTKDTGHPVAVKLGSITPEGTADVYCYACDDERVDSDLAVHLAHWGIIIADRVKTEKSLTELQIEQNLKWDFSMTTDDGQELKPLFGEGFTGLKNLGNSCYLASALQCLFSLPAFRQRYFLPQELPPATSAPAEDLETQLRKMADGILSGRFSKPDSDVIASEYSPEIPHQKGLAPAMLKHLIGKGHQEFSTMRQQDAFELLQYLLDLISKTQHPSNLGGNPVDSFRFVMEERLQCLSCKKVRYSTHEEENISVPVPVRRKPQSEPTSAEDKSKDQFESVTLKECLDIFTSDERVEFTCSSCSSKDGAIKRSRFKTLPTTLIVNARRIELVNWAPVKLDIPVIVGDEPFALDTYLSTGLQPHEELLPDDNSPATAKWTPNPTIIQDLMMMGFPEVRSEKALHATGNNDAEAAVNWLMGHMDDADIDVPVDFGGASTSTATGGGQVSESSIEAITAMGISVPQARKALKQTGGDIEAAIAWVFDHPDDMGDFDEPEPAQPTSTSSDSTPKAEPGTAATPALYQLSSIICHKGTSIHAGHYVAFIRKDIPGEEAEGKQWVLFNDEKVVKAGDVEEMRGFAYVYFFERV